MVKPCDKMILKYQVSFKLRPYGKENNLFPKDAIASGDWARISALCRDALDIVKEVRG